MDGLSQQKQQRYDNAVQTARHYNLGLLRPDGLPADLSLSETELRRRIQKHVDTIRAGLQMDFKRIHVNENNKEIIAHVRKELTPDQLKNVVFNG